ncbi:glycosyltransferase family 39 protein [Rhizohabitans arisaemae]|uniref:glycosyltransferase family 39 protein n=1 Tax=Rhizohabitans arisaemae TaxID=2720610 RepID=UPI0024B044D8|nr:glycosyltransferase family 39 protein [Rhizohabitans arisaemae]
MPAAVALALGLWRIDAVSYWADEGVSVSIAGRPWSDLPTILQHMDLAHAFYYVLLKCVIWLGGTGEIVTRLPSVIATAATAGILAALGRRIDSTTTGLCAGLIYALLPMVSRYAQEARQYALVTALVIGATYLLVVTVEQDPKRVRPWAGYALMLGVASWLHLYALFILPAHAAVLLRRRQEGVWSRWFLAAGTACALAAPLALAARSQVGLISWLPRPDLGTIRHLRWLVFGGNPVVIWTVLALAVIGLCVPLTPTVRTVALPWLVLPIGLMVAISLTVQPIFYPRYVLYCVGALALAAGAGVTRTVTWVTRRAPAYLVPVVLLALIAGFVGPAHAVIREPGTRPDDLRALAHALRDHARPGDAVLYVPAGNWMSVLPYPDSVAGLDTRTLHADTFFGELPPDRLRQALTGLTRIWLVQNKKSYGNALELHNDPRFRQTAHWSFGTRQLSRYDRLPTPQR